MYVVFRNETGESSEDWRFYTLFAAGNKIYDLDHEFEEYGYTHNYRIEN